MERIKTNVADYQVYTFSKGLYFDEKRMIKNLGQNIRVSSNPDRIEMESVDFVFSDNIPLKFRQGYKINFTDCTFQRVKRHKLDNFDCNLNWHSVLEFIRCKSPLLRVNNIHSLTIDHCEFSDIHIDSIEVVEFNSNEFHNLSIANSSFQAGLTISGNEAKTFALAECQVNGDLNPNYALA